MEQKKIKINNWNKLSSLKSLYIVSSLEELDDKLSGIIPKMLYRYEIVDIENTFIVVPMEFENQVRDIVSKVLVNSIDFSCLSVGG